MSPILKWSPLSLCRIVLGRFWQSTLLPGVHLFIGAPPTLIRARSQSVGIYTLPQWLEMIQCLPHFQAGDPLPPVSPFFLEGRDGHVHFIVKIVLICLVQVRLGNGAKRSPWHATSADVSIRPALSMNEPNSSVARKLKCDGGRPSCGQCVKRSNPCDYQPQNKRRGTVRLSRGEESESGDSGDDRSAEYPEPSLSPEVSSRRSSNFDTSPSLPLMGERRDELPPITTSSRAGYSGDQRNFFVDNELPHIATLSLPETSPSTPGPMSAPSLPPLRPASEQQAAQRKRSATVPGKSSRLPSTSGPKVVACNFCRGGL